MFNCAKEILFYHNEEVTLSRLQRTEMRDRRNANRDRLVNRLGNDSMPQPEMFIKQGSYAMLTMVKEPENDYDIDDGVYFLQSMLRNDDGYDLLPRNVRQMVCTALQDSRLNKQPSVKKNCVRIYYEEGFHVDMPVYRIREFDQQFELASGDEWVISRAADVEDWFDRVNQSRSPDESNGRQFRRIVRLIKKFARSRVSWKSKIASGFVITKLVEECYVADGNREDVALRFTLNRIYNRLVHDLEVRHPITPGSMLTNGPFDESTSFLKGKIRDALNELAVLDNTVCARTEALTAWNRVFSTDFFSYYQDDSVGDELNASNVTILGNLVSNRQSPRVVQKRGGGRFA